MAVFSWIHKKCFFVTGLFIGLWYGSWMRRQGYGDTLIQYYADVCAYKIDQEFPDDRRLSLIKWARSYVRTMKAIVP